MELHLSNRPVNQVYHGGDVVEGWIEFSGGSTLVLTKSVVVSFQGQLFCSFRAAAPSVTLEHSATLVLISHPPLLGTSWSNRANPRARLFQINPATHRFPFRFVLPSNLLPSGRFPGSTGVSFYIRYRLGFQMHTDNAILNHSKDWYIPIGGFTVPRPVVMLSLSPSTTFRVEKSFDFVLEDGLLRMRCIFPSRGVTLDSQNFVVRVEIDNQTGQSADHVSFTLQTFFDGYVSSTKKVSCSNVLLAKSPFQVQPHARTSCDFRVPFRAALTACPSLEYASNKGNTISIHNFLMVQLHLSSALRVNPRLKAKLTLYRAVPLPTRDAREDPRRHSRGEAPGFIIAPEYLAPPPRPLAADGFLLQPPPEYLAVPVPFVSEPFHQEQEEESAEFAVGAPPMLPEAAQSISPDFPDFDALPPPPPYEAVIQAEAPAIPEGHPNAEAWNDFCVIQVSDDDEDRPSAPALAGKESFFVDEKREGSWSLFSGQPMPPDVPLVLPWQLDHECQACPICQLEFGIFRRRSHCRYCGSVICRACAASSVVIPKLGSDPVRVCDRCASQSDLVKSCLAIKHAGSSSNNNNNQ